MKSARILLLMGLMTVPLAKAWAQDRCMVTSTADDVSVPGTLRYCIAQANSSPAPSFTINFNISSSGQVAEINATGEFLITRNNLLIDGYSQPGAQTNSNPAPQPLNARLGVSVGVRQSNLFVGYAVFRIESSGVIIRGLNIHSGPLYEIAICVTSAACNNNKIQGNFLGTDPSGTQSRPSGWYPWNPPYGAGVYIGGQSTGNIIGMDMDGSLDVTERNLISGENPPATASGFFGHGIFLDGTRGSPRATSIVGNLVGTNAALTASLGNNWGITIFNGVTSTIIAGNVIAGNNQDGVWAGVAGGSIAAVNNGITIYQNAIGINPNNNQALANINHGIFLNTSNQNVQIGNVNVANSSNIISGNAGNGITIYGAGNGSTSNIKIELNAIGTDTALANDVGNTGSGIQVIDTLAAVEINNNIVCGNEAAGIDLYGGDNTRITNNLIGVNPSGAIIPNTYNGIFIYCYNDHCTRGAVAERNYIVGNGDSGVGIFGGVTTCTIGSADASAGNYIQNNQRGGVFAMVADASNRIIGNDISSNNDVGVLLMGSSAQVSQNLINNNTGWGIGILPYYNNDASPATAADDIIGTPIIMSNQVDGNSNGGIILQDATISGAESLGTTNTIGNNNGQPDILQAWFGAIEILDSSNQPITSGNYQVTASSSTVNYSVTGNVPGGGLWGPSNFDYNDAFSWFFLISFLVDSNGQLIQLNFYNIQIVGPTSGSGVYTFDGVNNDSNLGGQPAGILTSGQFRYQVAEAVTKTDSDQDGVPDESDCAPFDHRYPRQFACDADTDGYCSNQIQGQVRQASCPNDANCQNGLCTPTDCLDSNAQVNPGRSEGPYGNQVCRDSLDNDCDTLADMNDPGCWQCAADADCQDNTVCNGTETCVNHVCQAGTALDCNDQNVCTDDSCDPANGCQHAANNNSCDDNNSCTENDHCSNGSCVGDPLDNDNDGYAAAACGGDDCDDNNNTINPGASEGPYGNATCADGKDNDCDGSTDAADSGCVQPAVCGDGRLTGQEQCDDGNDQAGDGCSATCQIEEGFACRQGILPSLCGSIGNAGDIVITEIMQNPACVSDTAGEWFEIKNVSDRKLVLKGWRIYDKGTDKHVINQAVVIEPGAFAVLCRNKDSSTNGGVACAYQWAGFQLGNDDDEILIADPRDGLVDGVDYTGVAPFPDPNGKSMSLDLWHTNAVDNDNGANWCVAKEAIPGGCGDLGSPGQANPPCGECPDADGDGHLAANCGGDDCDDNDAAVHPGNNEIQCNGKDDDCCESGSIACFIPTPDDSDPTDNDGDGYTLGCGQDCDDNDATIHPGAQETCGDNIDQDCNGSDLQCGCTDGDGDGHQAASCGGDDCDDNDANIHPWSRRNHL
jgi:cysteine-rich repeat protein